MSVLIVEDNSITARILEYNLTKLGHKTVLANSGKHALEYLENDSGIQLVITDIMMPEMSGLELLKTMKESPRWRDIPVIVCSAAADLEHVNEAASLGCKHFLTKPLNAELLMRRVADALRDEKPAIKPPSEVKRQLGLNDAGYAEISDAFCSLLKAQMACVTQGFANRSQTELNVDLAGLAEGAAALGAGPLLDSLNRLLGKRSNAQEGNTSSEYRAVLREMEIVLRALETDTRHDAQNG
jgi:CheY-like chemotaxis protein